MGTIEGGLVRCEKMIANGLGRRVGLTGRDYGPADASGRWLCNADRFLLAGLFGILASQAFAPRRCQKG